jgi:hypothetical protein
MSKSESPESSCGGSSGGGGFGRLTKSDAGEGHRQRGAWEGTPGGHLELQEGQGVGVDSPQIPYPCHYYPVVSVLDLLRRRVPNYSALVEGEPYIQARGRHYPVHFH